MQASRLQISRLANCSRCFAGSPYHTRRRADGARAESTHSSIAGNHAAEGSLLKLQDFAKAACVALTRHSCMDPPPLSAGGQPYAARSLSSVIAMAGAVVPCTLSDLIGNRVVMAGFVAWFAAQFGKIFTERYKKGYWDIRAFFAPGGTPSSHSSLCAGITTAIAMIEGLGSSLFAAALTFTVVVMYDAMGVRRHAGMHATVLNKVVSEMKESSGDPSSYDSIDEYMGGRPLKEVLGHTPRQVFSGGLLGVIVGVLYPMYF